MVIILMLLMLPFHIQFYSVIWWGRLYENDWVLGGHINSTYFCLYDEKHLAEYSHKKQENGCNDDGNMCCVNAAYTLPAAALCTILLWSYDSKKNSYSMYFLSFR